MRILLTAVFVCVLASSFAQKKVALFNGKNLNGWTIYVKEAEVSPEKLFYVKDGLLECAGVPLGYIRTKKEYSNYKLHIEWRYPEKPTNSGVFIHTSGPDKIWPNHYQGQLKYQNSGDFIVQGEGISATVRDTVYTSTAALKPTLIKQQSMNENPANQWNSYDFTCKGNSIEVRVNGVLQNTATNCSLSKGGIGLQAEGSKIQFRNLWVQKIKK